MCDWASQHDPHMADTAGSLGFIRQIQNLSAGIKRLVLLPRYFYNSVFFIFFVFCILYFVLESFGLNQEEQMKENPLFPSFTKHLHHRINFVPQLGPNLGEEDKASLLWRS